MSDIYPGDIVSHSIMCTEEGRGMLQRGMNFKKKNKPSIILMSLRKGAPYADAIEDNGKILIYEGHDVKKSESEFPKLSDQLSHTARGTITQNGKFFQAAEKFKKTGIAELVKVYEKIKDGIWVYNGLFELIDAWIETSGNRKVFKFKLRVTDKTIDEKEKRITDLKDLDHNRMIPTSVKLEVWKRDKGECIQCHSKDNLHFDHILPYSKGGTSLKAENIQLLCARHNLQKQAKII